MFSRHIRSTLALLLFSGVACTDGSSQTNGSATDQRAISGATSPGEAQQGTTRRLWVTNGWELVSWWIDISPDGKRVVFSDDGVGVRDLETGTTVPLTSDLYTEQPLFSPDGSQVAFGACCEPGYSLRIGPSDRADSRVLLNQVQGVDWEDRSINGELVPHDWSPDGRSILVSFPYEVPAQGDTPARQEHVLVEVSVEDGSYRPLGERPDGSSKYFSGRQGEEPPGRVTMRNPRYSPDGRFIAFGRPVDVEGSSDHLYTLRLADQTEIDLRLEPHGLMGWSADGSGVFYADDGRDGVDVWFLPVRDGAASGPPRLVRSGLATGPGWVEGDRFYYIIDAEFPGLHTATVDVSSGRVLSPPTRVPEEQGLGDWSPNGQQLAFESAHDPETGRGSFVVRSVAGNNRREFAAPEGSNRIDWVRWLPRSNAIVAEIRMPIDPTSTETPRHMMRLDLETGRYTDLGPARLRPGAAEFAGDGSLLYTVTRGGIVAVDLGRHSAGDGLGRGEGAACDAGWPMDLGDCRTVYSPPVDDQTCPTSVALDLSPNEDEIVAVSDGCILRVPTRGGTARVILREVGIDNSSVQWTPDGSHILFIRSGAGQNADELRVIPASGGEAKTLFSYPNLEGVRIHPDGRRIMFRGGEVREELWVLENLPGFGR
jgi:Tol biopolymer transport system component